MSNLIIKNYKNSLKFLGESKKYIIFALCTFLLFFIIGFLFPIFFKERIAEVLIGLKDLFADKNLFETFILIFLNNLRASGFAMIFGIGFGIIPFFILIVNGYLLGFVSRSAVENENIFVLWKLLPHGIFELPAVLFSAGMGIKLGVSLLDKRVSLKKEVKKSLIGFLCIIIPLLIIAAIIESILIFLTK